MYQDMATTDPRAALRGRLTMLAGLAETLPPPVLAGQIEELRRAALAEGLTAVDRTAHAFIRALGQSRCRNSFAHWFAALSDAIGESADRETTTDAWTAWLGRRDGRGRSI